MTSDTIRQLLYEILTERQIKEYDEEMELNTAFNLEGVGAFRISAFRQKGSPAVVVTGLEVVLFQIWISRTIRNHPPFLIMTLGALFFTAGLVLFVVASILCGLAGTPDVLNAARVLQGIPDPTGSGAANNYEILQQFKNHNDKYSAKVDVQYRTLSRRSS